MSNSLRSVYSNLYDAITVNTLGLFCDIVGAALLFWFGLPADIRRAENKTPRLVLSRDVFLVRGRFSSVREFLLVFEPGVSPREIEFVAQITNGKNIENDAEPDDRPILGRDVSHVSELQRSCRERTPRSLPTRRYS